MKEVFIAELEPWESHYLKDKLKGYRTTFSSEPLIDPSAQAKKAEILGVFIHTPVTESLLKELPNLKFITTMSTGFDHINLEACKKHNIIVSNVPSYGENTVAEHTFGLMLTLSRKLNLALSRTQKHSFDIEGLMGFDLKGKTLGVIGAGHIGQHVIDLARAFKMNVLVYTSHPPKKKVSGLNYVSLNQLFRNADIITLHVPLTKETRYIIDKSAILKMKRGVYLINTARGELVNTKALLFGLKSGIIAGAALDVIEDEQHFNEHRRRKTRDLHTDLQKHLEELHQYNVVITPHCAFCTREAIERILDMTVDNIKSFSRGRAQNVLT